VIRSTDRLVVLAAGDGAVRIDLAGPAGSAVEADAIVTAPPRPATRERTLILGWNRRGASIIRELDEYVAPGSELLAVSALSRITDEVASLTELRNLRATGRCGDTTSRPVLDALDVASFTHVIALCEVDDRDADSADARTLVTLLHLRDIGTKLGRSFSIVSEMVDPRDRELAEVARADDFIVSARVVSLLLAQIAETPELADVFRDLFDADGAEVYLKEAADYVVPGREVSFATVQAAAQARAEIALGYRVIAKATDAQAAYGVVLNPARDARVRFAPGDRVVVLAER
jgi:hypothetical protein